NSFYFQVFPSENTECLLEGLQRMFHHMGRVPKTIRFDNLSPAVKKIFSKGERELTDTFERFVLHYGFQYEFCNPGKGNEKDRKSTRLNSSHVSISYAVFCLKKKKYRTHIV